MKRKFSYSRYAICADKEQLKKRKLDDRLFDVEKGVENAKVIQACTDCPVQVICFEETVLFIRMEMPEIGVRAGMKTGDIRTMKDKPDQLATRVLTLATQQAMARKALGWTEGAGS
jgi:hypothetical protein